MPRVGRIVVPGYPHHVTQRGVRSLAVFFSDQDRLDYLDLLRTYGGVYGVSFLVYCLMTNHVHLIAVPEEEDSLARAIGEAHRRYTRMINFRQKVRGYLFQGRFHSCVLDEEHLLYAVRYVELNPVRARVKRRPQDYLWSSARFHMGLCEQDPLINCRTLMGLVDDWADVLQIEGEHDDVVRCRTRTGRPCGSEDFVGQMEDMTGRQLLPKKPGPQPAAQS